MKYVIIFSNIDITVTKGIGAIDKTNYNSHTGNNLNVEPTWVKTTVDIRRGQHTYPAEIVEWPSVKGLEERKLITVGRETDEIEDEADKSAIDKFKASIAEVIAAEPRRRRKKAETVEEPAEE